VRDASSVRKVAPGAFLLNGVASDVTITAFQFPVLGTIALTNGDTGSPF